jgi:hypothetical protein
MNVLATGSPLTAERNFLDMHLWDDDDPGVAGDKHSL